MLQAAWGLLCIPLVPLLLTPVPNLPLYYAGYKVTCCCQGLRTQVLKALLHLPAFVSSH